MNTGVRELVIAYIDEALDVDDLECAGDFIQSVLIAERVTDWQTSSTLKNLYSELSEVYYREPDRSRKTKIKTVLTSIEVDYRDVIIEKEIETIQSVNRNG